MKICFLSTIHPPFDKRVFDKEAVTLAEGGHVVVHLAPDEHETHQYVRGVDIYTYPRSRGLISRLLQLPRLYSRAVRVDADVYHCNEVDSWLVGVFLKRFRRKQLVFDAHELYSHRLTDHMPTVLRPLMVGIMRLLFRLLALYTDRIVLAKESAGVDYLSAREKWVLVRNYSPLSMLNAVGQGEDSTNTSFRHEGQVRAIHLGLISRVRGWPQLLAGLSRMECKSLFLHIVGTFNDNSREDFEQQVRLLGLEDRVLVEDWMPFEEAYRRLLAADIGLVLFQPGLQNHVAASPHKLFDYMSAGLAVVVPNFASEIAAMVVAEDCGELVDPANPQAIADVLDGLVVDVAKRKSLGCHGRAAMTQRYNWEMESVKLLAMYDDLAAESTVS